MIGACPACCCISDHFELSRAAHTCPPICHRGVSRSMVESRGSPLADCPGTGLCALDEDEYTYRQSSSVDVLSMDFDRRTRRAGVAFAGSDASCGAMAMVALYPRLEDQAKHIKGICGDLSIPLEWGSLPVVEDINSAELCQEGGSGACCAFNSEKAHTSIIGDSILWEHEGPGKRVPFSKDVRQRYEVNEPHAPSFYSGELALSSAKLKAWHCKLIHASENLHFTHGQRLLLGSALATHAVYVARSTGQLPRLILDQQRL